MKMLDLTLKELRLIAKYRNINPYKNMPKDKLLTIINIIIRENKNFFLSMMKYIGVVKAALISLSIFLLNTICCINFGSVSGEAGCFLNQ